MRPPMKERNKLFGFDQKTPRGKTVTLWFDDFGEFCEILFAEESGEELERRIRNSYHRAYYKNNPAYRERLKSQMRERYHKSKVGSGD